MNELSVISPENLGWISTKLGPECMDYLWKCIDNKKKDYRYALAGNISKSYELEDKNGWFSRNVLRIFVEQYEKSFGNRAKSTPTVLAHPFSLHGFWINYQKKHEFNPLHSHTGVYSFVIWMKIPFDYEDQINLPNCKGSNHPLNSGFVFEYLDILGNMKYHSYGLSKGDEGNMLFFPSELHHQVYPFYNCDKTRISISGNILLDTSRTL